MAGWKIERLRSTKFNRIDQIHLRKLGKKVWSKVRPAKEEKEKVRKKNDLVAGTNGEDEQDVQERRDELDLTCGRKQTRKNKFVGHTHVER